MCQFVKQGDVQRRCHIHRTRASTLCPSREFCPIPGQTRRVPFLFQALDFGPLHLGQEPRTHLHLGSTFDSLASPLKHRGLCKTFVVGSAILALMIAVSQRKSYANSPIADKSRLVDSFAVFVFRSEAIKIAKDNEGVGGEGSIVGGKSCCVCKFTESVLPN